MLEKLAKINIFDKKQSKINSLENQIETLESALKDELFKEFMKKLSEPMENERLKRENKRLRLQIRSLREIIKEGH